MAAPALEPRSPAEMFREIFALLNRHDASLLLPYWDDDIVEEFPTGTVRGKEAVRDYFAGLFAAIPDFSIEPLHIAAEGNQVFVRWHATGTFTGAPWMGLDPTGSRLDLSGIDCFTLKNGRVVHNFVAYDQMAFARQIGMMPPQGSTLELGMMATFNLATRVRKAIGR